MEHELIIILSRNLFAVLMFLSATRSVTVSDALCSVAALSRSSLSTARTPVDIQRGFAGPSSWPQWPLPSALARCSQVADGRL